MKKTRASIAFFLLFLLQSTAHSAEAPAPKTPFPPAVGEIFGQPVLQEEFDFAFKTTGIFSTTGKEAKTDRERRSETWQHILFLKEARKRGFQVSHEEVVAELTRLLAEKNVVYGSLNYHEFIQKNFQENAAQFEKRLEDLLMVKKMLDQILHPPAPVITEKDAKQKFLNQYNSMATEFVNLPTLEEANAFYKKMTPKKWDEEKKKNPKFATPTGHISLEAVIDLWQVPAEDAYRLHDMAIGKIGAPAKMYKGYGVFRMLEKKDADLKDYTDKKKEEYLKILEQVYYYNKTQKVVQDIVKDAALRDYEKDQVVTLETTQGTLEVQLNPDLAPKACENFIGLTQKKYYDGTIFHRVIKGFMVQGGDPTGTGRGGESLWGKPFEDEVKKEVQFDSAGILAMANSGPNTNASQFFITLGPALHLNMKHTIFGQVTSGFETLQKIGQTPTGPEDRPVQEQKILKMTVKQWPTSLSFKK